MRRNGIQDRCKTCAELLTWAEEAYGYEYCRRCAIDRVRRMKGKHSPKARPLVEAIDDLMAGVPDEALAAVPTDLAVQHDHYLYGTPKVRPGVPVDEIDEIDEIVSNKAFKQSLRDLREGRLHDHRSSERDDVMEELG